MGGELLRKNIKNDASLVPPPPTLNLPVHQLERKLVTGQIDSRGGHSKTRQYIHADVVETAPADGVQAETPYFGDHDCKDLTCWTPESSIPLLGYSQYLEEGFDQDDFVSLQSEYYGSFGHLPQISSNYGAAAESPCVVESPPSKDSSPSVIDPTETRLIYEVEDGEQPEQPAQPSHRLLNIPEPVPRAVGPSQEWTVRKQRRGRKPGSGKIREKDPTPPKMKKQPKRNGPLCRDVRDGAAFTKSINACRLCHYKKVRCIPNPLNPLGLCLQCEKTRPTTALCFRYVVMEASVYRQQDAPSDKFSKRWNSMDIVDIPIWASDEVYSIAISQTFLEAPYHVRVRRFVPSLGDTLEEIWHDGNGFRTCSLPPYAFESMTDACDAMKAMIDRNAPKYYGQLESLMGGKESNETTYFFFETYLHAFRHMSLAATTTEQTLMANVYRLWVACRLTSFPEAIVDGNALGIPPVDDPLSPWHGKSPVPPVMVAQIECIVYSQFLRPLSTSVLSQLNELIGKRKPEYWFTIYLAIFMLLHSCSMMARRDMEYARQLNMKDFYANEKAIQAQQAGAVTLLAHFHGVIDGSQPFRLASRYRLGEYQGNLTPEQDAFIQKSVATVRAIREEQRRQKLILEPVDNLYWILQLYEEDWKLS